MMQPMSVQVIKQKTAKLLLGTGVTQIVFGILLIIASALDIALSCTYRYGLAYVSSGIWSGVIILSAGAVAVAASKKRKVNTTLTDASLGMSIVASIFSVAPIACGITGLATFSPYGPYYCGHYSGDFHYDSYVASLVLNSFLLAFGVATFITSIVGAVYVCQIKEKRRLPQVPMIIQTNNGPMMLIPANFQGSVPYQPNVQVQQPVLQPVSPQSAQQQHYQSLSALQIPTSNAPSPQPMASPVAAQDGSNVNQAFAISSEHLYPVVPEEGKER